jgi:hypothetical protein
MPTARWHQGADFAHAVLSKKRIVQPLPPSSASASSSAALSLTSLSPGTVNLGNAAFELHPGVSRRVFSSRRAPE